MAILKLDGKAKAKQTAIPFFNFSRSYTFSVSAMLSAYVVGEGHNLGTIDREASSLLQVFV